MSCKKTQRARKAAASSLFANIMNKHKHEGEETNNSQQTPTGDKTVDPTLKSGAKSNTPHNHLSSETSSSPSTTHVEQPSSTEKEITHEGSVSSQVVDTTQNASVIDDKHHSDDSLINLISALADTKLAKGAIENICRTSSLGKTRRRKRTS